APTAPQKTQKNTKTVSVVSDDLKTSPEKIKLLRAEMPLQYLIMNGKKS
ncbi:hypothetical protein ABNIH1_11408, partial [Acinetobacter baumannii ABNIH1]